MAIMREFVKVISTAAILFSNASFSAMSQEQTRESGSQHVVQELFDGDDSSLMLGGRIDLSGDKKSPWLSYVADGELVIENRLEPQSIHYNDIAWVKYPESGILESTENSVISVIVEVKNTGRGGAGFLVGSGKAGAYLMFSVDGQGRYHVIRKEGRNARTVHSAKHAAILVGAPNQLTFEMRGANVVFIANGVEIIQIPDSNRKNNSRRLNGQTGIGLAVFGIGTFAYDSVEISQAN